MKSFIAGSGGGGCFTGDTLVSVPEGSKRIDELKEGEYVISFDDRGELHKAKILKIHIHENEEVFSYEIWGGIELKATPNHWVLNQFNAFVGIGSLGTDDCVIDASGHLRPIKSSTKIPNETVYNLTVENQHTFIANNICVHNAGLGQGKIFGAGGGKGAGGSSPDIKDDNLNSRAYARIIDLLGEGEIEGFPSARQYEKGSIEYRTAMLKDVYFDKTSVLRQSAPDISPGEGDYNFKNISYEDFDLRFGTQDQSYIPGYEAAETEYSVNIIVQKNAPVTRTITDEEVDRVRVTLRWEALQRFEDDGDISGATVEYQIQVSRNGAAFTTVVDTEVTGRSGDPFEKSHVIDITGGPFPVDVRVVRITKNYTSNPKRQTSFSWATYTEIVDAKLRYPNSALFAMEVDSRNFSSIPTRSYRVRGIKIRIPSNATVDQTNGRLIYAPSSVWDGTFGPAVWASDPVWALWDLLTNCRYGFGQQVKPRDLDKWSFYKASEYSNELVDTGLLDESGSPILEPRFSCNVCIQTEQEAYKLINDMCSVFRAMPYWGAGTVVISQDRPTDPTYLFNQTNVSDAGFQYSGSSLKTRHTVAMVGYLDTETQEITYESVEDPQAIAKYGVNTIQVTAFACTSRTQAHRVGEWLLYTEQYETETVTFETGMDGGIAVRPGSVICVSDPVRSGVRRGGRIRDYGSNYIAIDEALATDTPTGGIPTVLIAMEDGTVEEKSVVTVSDGTIVVSGAFESTPLIGGAFIYDDASMQKTLWRVVSVEESEASKYAITAVAYNKTKYNYIERGNQLEKKIFLPLDIPPPTDPKNVTAQVATYESTGQLVNKMILSWESDSTAVQYQVRYRLVG